MNSQVTRREMLGLMSRLSAALAASSTCWPAAPAARKRMGVTIASYGLRAGNASRNPGAVSFTALDFLDHCHNLEAGGIQVGIGPWEKDFISQLRRKAQEWEMYIEGQVRLPEDQADLPRFERQIRTARETGASVVRSVTMNGRRYETFETADAFRAFADQAWNSIRLAEPVVRKERVRLAIENHKDWRAPELIEMLTRLSSEFVGVCLDTGNSISLLEDPMEVVEAYAPWAFTTHFKDMGVQEYADGFLLSEVPLGEGFFNLPKMIAMIHRARPGIELNLEMITRDPLKVPCLGPKYWVTFESVKGKALADTLRTVRTNASKKALPAVSGLTRERSVEYEEENVKQCFRHAQERLGLGRSV